MRTASPSFQQALKSSHRPITVVEVLDTDVLIGTLTGGPDAGTVMSGDVTLDSTASSRGRFDLVIVDDGSRGLVPSVASDLLAPYGHEVRISRGLILPGSNNRETVKLGVFRIDEADVDDGPDGLTISLSGMDRSGRVIDAKFESAGQIAAGTNVETAILFVITPAYPTVTAKFPGLPFTTPLLRWAEGDDRWQFAQDLATACGCVLFFDADGDLRIDPLIGSDPVMTIAEGPDGVLLKAGKKWARADACNRVIATGENTGETTPYRGVATDDDPSSPTYYFGPFGRKPVFYQSQFIASNSQAFAAADGILRRQLGTTETVTFDSLIDPRLEPGDTARITRMRAGINEDHIIDQLTIPLGSDQPMSGTTRARQVTA